MGQELQEVSRCLDILAGGTMKPCHLAQEAGMNLFVFGDIAWIKTLCHHQCLFVVEMVSGVVGKL